MNLFASLRLRWIEELVNACDRAVARRNAHTPQLNTEAQHLATGSRGE
jgi:hypothetical protein